MGEETFRAAVEIARNILRREREVWGATAPEGMVRLYERRAADTREDYLRDLIWCSEEIAVAWDSLSLIARGILRDGEQLPDALAEWVVDVLDDQTKPKKDRRRPRPTRRGQDPDGKLSRNRAVMVAVRHLASQGIRATRNMTRKRERLPEACFEGGSACDAVGIAAGMNYKAIEGIWTDSASPESPIYRFAYRHVPRLPYAISENK